MTVRQLVQFYESGAIVKNELLYRALDVLNPDDADGDLEQLPPHLYGELSAIVERWRSGEMRSPGGAVTTPVENILAARRWLRAKEKLGTGRA